MGVGARSVDYGAQGAVHSVSAIMAKGMRIVVFTANIRVLRQTGSAAGDLPKIIVMLTANTKQTRYLLRMEYHI